MRDDLAVTVAGKVVIQHCDGVAGIELAISIEIAQQFLFLGVDADDRPPRRQVLLLEFGNPLELRMAVGMPLERCLLLRLATHEAVMFEQKSPDAARGIGTLSRTDITSY
jgi:hypothetical protein